MYECASAGAEARTEGDFMTDETILLFLHGVGKGYLHDEWKAPLTAALARLGYPGLEGVRVIAPRYAHALKAVDEKESLPAVTIRQPSGDAARRNRRAFERRTAALELRLGHHDGGPGAWAMDQVVDGAVQSPVPVMKQARNYARNEGIRAHVLRRILGKLPASGRVVVVGHSLGSVIAADLLRRLPKGLEVVGMVTIGSPLASANFDVDKFRETLKDPPTNLSWWVNVWNAQDPIVANRGVSSVFPWMIDVRINAGLGVPAHDASQYLANDAVAAAIGFALFGSTSKELAIVEQAVEIPLDYAETIALMALRYAYLVSTKLAGDQRDRYIGALRQVQATAFDGVHERNMRYGRPLPTSIARLAFDLSDVNAVAPAPDRISHLFKEEAVVPLVSIMATNILRPFEITVPKNVQREALEELVLESGLGKQIAVDAFAAVDEARKALAGGGINWVKWIALGVGAAAVVATSGLALAAAPVGLAGAAAITSALAAFGPGGMIGGLLTAGALVSVSAGGIGVGLASPATSAETVEAVVATQLTVAILRKRQSLEQDPAVWASLVETEIEVRRQHEQLDEFSDDSAPGLKDLKRKIELVDRALTYLRKNGLEPGVVTAGDDGV